MEKSDSKENLEENEGCNSSNVMALYTHVCVYVCVYAWHARTNVSRD